MVQNGKNSIVFGLKNGGFLAKKVTQLTGLRLGTFNIIEFADGEILVKSNDTIRGLRVFLFQSTSFPVNDNLLQLLIAIDSLKRADAKSITAIIPYYGYARQDRKSKGREPITCKLVANFLQVAGASKIILTDIHSDQTQGFFDIPVDTLVSTPILIKHFLQDYQYSLKKLKIVAPDHGAVKKARNVAACLGVGLVVVDKRRTKKNMVEVGYVLGDVNGYDCLLIDDMIDTGMTILNNIQILKSQGAKRIYVMVAHGIFSQNSIRDFLQALNEGLIEKIYVTDSIQTNNQVQHDKFHVISLAPFYAEILDAEINHKSLLEIYQKHWNEIKHFVALNCDKS